MYFFNDNLKSNSSHLIPSYSFINELRNSNSLVKRTIDEICIHDVIFDIKFLKISYKEEFSTAKGIAYKIKAFDFNDNSYNAFIFSGSEVNLLKSEEHDRVYDSVENIVYFPN